MEKNGIKKWLLLIPILLSIILFRQSKTIFFGAGQTTEEKIIAFLESNQQDYFTQNGKYQHIADTFYGNGYSYSVNEFLYPDGTKGYQILITQQTSINLASGTTPVIKQWSIGVGEDSDKLTWTK